MVSDKNTTPQLHPKGAPYNPFDPTENRPLGGYPSEFAVPGTQTNSGSIQPATEFQRVQYAMNHLGYHPRPRSLIYPGQYKLLRKIDDRRSRFWKGARKAAWAVIGCGLVYIVFFHRWNDGYDNIFSPFYRFQLKTKWAITGKISKEEYEDLFPKQKGYVSNGYGLLAGSKTKSVEEMEKHESKFALERPTEDQIMRAERQMQEQEEALLKAMDLAEANLKNQANGNLSLAPSVQNDSKKSSWWKFF